MALALLLSAEVFKYTESESVTEETRIQYREFADKLFGLVSGVSFPTLVINGPTSGPLLKQLGLVTPTATRQKVASQYLEHMEAEHFACVFTITCRETLPRCRLWSHERACVSA